MVGLDSLRRRGRFLIVVAGLFALAANASPALADTQTFTTAGCSSWSVPAGVLSVEITATGSAGESYAGFIAGGGSGDVLSGTLSGLTVGQKLDVCVDQGGGAGGSGSDASDSGGAGGGASGVALGSDFSTPVLVAGGGGGGGAYGSFAGGSAGSPKGAAGASNTGNGGAVGGGGGTQSGGGTGGAASTRVSCGSVSGGQDGGAFSSTGPGAGGAGGNTTCEGGGGGGGGYYGGGGGGAGDVDLPGGNQNGGGAGGGGGSDFCAVSLTPLGCTFGTPNASYGTASVVLTYTAVASPPTASITTPVNGAAYIQGQVVDSSFSCTEGTGGPGIKSCLDQNGRPSGAAIDTSIPGQYTFTVTATSQDGLKGQAAVTYTVVSPPPAARAPVAVTGAAGNITYASATLNGTVNPDGSATTYYFEYGTSSAYGHQTSTNSAGADGAIHPASASISGLAPARRYHYRIVAVNAAGTSHGADRTFNTPAQPLKLMVSPTRTLAGTPDCFVFRTTSIGHPVPGVKVRLAHRTARTSHAGKATICLRLHHGVYHPTATKTRYKPVRTSIAVSAPPKPTFTG